MLAHSVITVFVFACLLWGRRIPSHRADSRPRTILLKIGAAAAGGVLLLQFIAFVGVLQSPVYTDHSAAAVTILAMHAGAGMPVYSPVGSETFFSQPYGPSVFLLPSLLLPFFDNPVTAVKFSSFLMFFSGVALTATVLAKRYGATTALWGAAAAAAIPVFNITQSKETVGYLGVALAIFGGFYSRRIPFAVLAGLGVALAALSKLFAGIALGILLPLLWLRQGWRFVATTTAVGMALVAMLFWLHPSFSWTPYWQILFRFAEEGAYPLETKWYFFKEFLPGTLQLYGAMLIVLTLYCRRQWTEWETKEQWAMVTTLALTATTIVLFSWATVSNIGSVGGGYLGYLHLPLIFLAADLVARGQNQPHRCETQNTATTETRLLAAMAAVAVLIVILPFHRLMQYDLANLPHATVKNFPDQIHIQNAGIVRQEAQRLVLRLDGLKVDVGVTDVSRYHLYNWAKPEIYRRSPWTATIPASLMQHLTQAEWENINAAFNRQETDVFLIPRDGELFSISSWLLPFRKLYPPDFIAAFKKNYTCITADSPLFDVWAAKNRADDIAERWLATAPCRTTEINK